MSQTNIQVPIEQRNHNREVLEKRKILYGPDRRRSEGPAALGSDPHPAARINYHTSLGAEASAGHEAPDMLYGGHVVNAGAVVAGMPGMGDHKFTMSGRRHPDEINDLNRELNAGSTH